MSENNNTGKSAPGNKKQSLTFRLSNMQRYLHEDMPVEMKEFVDGGKSKSGYKNLDAVTNLYPGLYVVGAISSLGKTTFIHQMADQIAAQGHEVLVFSLEMSRNELIAKTYVQNISTDPRVKVAVDEYSRYANNLLIAECTFRATIDTIEGTVTNYIQKTGKKPVVIVDYLQVIQAPLESRMTAKDLVDLHVRRLKQLQSENKLVLIVISSLNRQNYLTQIDYESFKESGGIEYTADVVWGLQLEALHDDIFDRQAKINEKRQKVKEAKAANPRRIELVCLKNRFGISSYSCMFDYYPQFDYFCPVMDNIDDTILTGNVDQDGFITIPDGYGSPFDIC